MEDNGELRGTEREREREGEPGNNGEGKRRGWKREREENRMMQLMKRRGFHVVSTGETQPHTHVVDHTDRHTHTHTAASPGGQMDIMLSHTAEASVT